MIFKDLMHLYFKYHLTEPKKKVYIEDYRSMEMSVAKAFYTVEHK